MYCTAKTVVFVMILIGVLALPGFTFPTYTVTPGEADGTYGATDIPIVYYDETGKQLFDGDYGKVDWAKKAVVTSETDYWARYDDQKGYALPWVGWRYVEPVVTFNMGQSFVFHQVGMHAYYRTPDIYLPGYIAIKFSNDGSNYFGGISQATNSDNIVDDEVYWRVIDFSPVHAQYARITFDRAVWLLSDEVSINGMDGAQFAAVPEPSSHIVLGTLLTPFLFRRRRQK